tara:strand:- start:18190 stop:19266 length:1077 start_codon:yes stop_codon:yes gene_type:complete
MLEIYAGKNALKTIQEHGFKQELFTNFLGASGGPKWFSLFGLDKYLFGDFFKDRTTELNLIGSSAGAFRAACLAQNNPVEAIDRLAEKYAHTVYNGKPSVEDISNSAIEMLDHLFGKTGINETINNTVFKAHFIVAKSKGLTSYENKLIQGAGLLASILLNKVDRKLLAFQYERYIYRPSSSQIIINDPYYFSNHYIDFTKENIGSALLASGSIPMVMSGIQNIHGSPKGMYRDGGIIDYHFDFSLENKSIENKNNTQGLTLYPHFSAKPKAGWFDKNSSRQVQPKSYENTVLVVPSAKFVELLPFSKIPDRSDFQNLDANTRINYWLTVLSETDRLAVSLNEFIVKQDLGRIKTFVS